MPLREKLNQNPMYAAVAVVAMVVIAGVFYFMGGSDAAPSTDAYYSADDGKTWFAYKAEGMPPVDYKGKPAVRAYLFKCADGKQFVGYLEKYTEDAKGVLEEASRMNQQGQRPDMQKVQHAATTGRLVKRPADSTWTNAADMQSSAKVLTVTCPDQSRAVAAN